MRQLLSACFVALSLVAFAQGQSVKITVLSEGSSAPIPDVAVYTAGDGNGGVTNSSGSFELDLAPGIHPIVIRSVGFQTLRDTLIVPSDKNAFNYYMRESITELPEVAVNATTITGGLAHVERLGGAAVYLSPKLLAEQKQTDIGRMLREVSGISVQDEDGFGLRPNIGIRGSGSERSSKITLMEDGILMAPAPYIAPAAYYFPTAGRMQGIEVLKGSSQIAYGPITTGGAVNLISTQIPNEFGGMIDVQGGAFGTRAIHAHVGQSGPKFGFLVEHFQYGSDGFKELDGGGETGFQKEDYIAKFRYRWGNEVRQSLNLKLGLAREESNETYLGLTLNDFESTPYRRYAASQNDLMTTEQEQYSLRYTAQLGSNWQLTSVVYRNDFHRNWYKLDKVLGTSIADVLNDPMANDSAYQVITGADSEADALSLKANNRDYYAQGWETNVEYKFNSGQSNHKINFGTRLHEDQIDRFQWVDGYQMTAGDLYQTSSGVPGTESNRVETARAWATFVRYELQRGAWTFMPGIRHEAISMERIDYGKGDPDRTGIDISERNNNVNAFMPGASVEYVLNESSTLFAGAHKGFAPPGTKEGTNPEESWNYELGWRHSNGLIQWSAVAFLVDYENLLGVDLSAGGGTGTGDLFNGGTAQSYGLELSASYDPFRNNSGYFHLPLRLNYTFTQAEFTNDFDSDFDPWGSVTSGDALPYIADHRLNWNLSAEYRKWDVHLSGQWQTDMRARAGSGDIATEDLIPAYHVMDLSLEYHLNSFVELYGNLRNITDEQYLVALRPAGGRPGLPRLWQVGVRATF